MAQQHLLPQVQRFKETNLGKGIMDHWEQLVRDYERSAESGPQRALQLLSELTLTAPASAVRRYHSVLVEASKRCPDRGVRKQLTGTVELLRQRASITDSSLSVQSPTPEPSSDVDGEEPEEVRSAWEIRQLRKERD